MGSNAVSQSAVSSVVGYLLAKGYFNPSSPNLPQNISILAEANTANQSGLSLLPVQITSSAQAGNLYGYGSPIYSIARILFPATGTGVAIPVTVYPQEAASGAVAKVITVTPTGTATAAGTVYLNIAGRETLDGDSYAVNIAVGDDPTAICGKFRTAIAAVLGCPVLGSGTTTFVATAKWTGLTSNDISISVDTTSSTLVGVTFAVVNTTAGSGTPSVTGAGNGLELFGNAWNTIVINSYGLVSATMGELEAYNGVPDPVNPTGQYAGIIQRPMIALSGTCLDDPTSITNDAARQNQVTIVPCVAPLSLGMPYEAAANVAVLLANIFQNSPQSDVINLTYPDMPPPAVGSIPAMNSYTVRDAYVKKGCSTVDFVAGAYVIKDLVTTYNMVGENPPFYRYPRDLNIHWNVKYGYHLMEKQQLVGKTIVKDSDTVTAANVVKPKMWKASVAGYLTDCVNRALLTDAPFMTSSISVTINLGNPNRLDTTFNTKITGIVRISSTTDTSGFNFTN